MILGSSHPVWSVLTEDLVFDLLDQIPRMVQFLSEALVRLACILMQHPKMTLHRLHSFYRDGSSPFFSVLSPGTVPSSASMASSASAASESNPASDPASFSAPISATGSVSQSDCAIHSSSSIEDDPGSLGTQVPPVLSGAPQSGPIVPSGGVCCRNGKRVGLSGSGSSEAEVCSNVGDVSVSVGSKRSGGGEGNVDGSDRPGKRAKASGSGLGKGKESLSSGGKGSVKKGKDTAKKGKDAAKKGNGSSSKSAPVWLSDGIPPKLDEGAKGLFFQLASLHTNCGMESLAALLSDLVSGGPSDADLTSYDLSFSSILSQCVKASCAKSVKSFHLAILYIRLAIHAEE